MKPFVFYLIALVVIAADQISKSSIVKSMPLFSERPVLGEFLYLYHTRNTGGAFSLFQSANSTFILVAFIAVGALIYAYHRHQRVNMMVSAALSLALGGAIGNLIDRVRYGYVIDFFDLRAWTGKNVWPVFNVADSAITVGILLLAWHFLFTKEPEKTRDQSSVISDPSHQGIDN